LELANHFGGTMGYVVIPASSFCDSYLQVSIVNKLADV
jgi:hypothetical protein